MGVCADSVNRQRKFDEKHTLGFPLLSDRGGKVARLFGVKRFAPLPPKRTTFVIDQDRRIVRAICSESDMAVHTDEALAALRELQSGA